MRTLGPILLLVLVAGLFGGFAWLTRHPETPWLEQAEDWPLVGELASRFRVTYLGPAARRNNAAIAPGGAEADVAEPQRAKAASSKRRSESTKKEVPQPPTRITESIAPEPRPSSSTPEGPFVIAPTEDVDSVIAAASTMERSGFETHMPREIQSLEGLPDSINEWVWCLPGNQILAAAEPGAEVQTLLRSMAYLPVLERRDAWAEVRFRGRRGWIDTSWEPSHPRGKAGRGILRHRAEPVRASNSRRLKQARKILGMDRPSRKLGAYTLYTDVEDEELLGFLYLAAGTAEDAYFARYGRLPAGNPERSAVLFAKEADYRRFSSSGLSGTESGHAGGGVLAFFAEGRSQQALARTLVHEIGHLLNDRAIALWLPPWLEEGIASDLGSVWVEGTPGVPFERSDFWSMLSNGVDRGLLRLASTHKMGKLPSVAVLMSIDREIFQTNRAYVYAHSAGFVRYLLDSEDAGHGEPFRLFLKRIAVGHGADPALLLRLLETDAEQLDRSFRAWLLAETVAARATD